MSCVTHERAGENLALHSLRLPSPWWCCASDTPLCVRCDYDQRRIERQRRREEAWANAELAELKTIKEGLEEEV
jgi:hypothetical protein